MSKDTDRRPGLRPFGALIAGPTRKAFKGHGLAQADLAVRWPDIVGEQLARSTLPERLSFPKGRSGGATLTLRVGSAFAPHVQHLTPLIIEKINTFFGHAAVAKIQLLQRPLPPRKAVPVREARALTPGEQSVLDATLGSVEDDALRQDLAALGRRVLAARGP